MTASRSTRTLGVGLIAIAAVAIWIQVVHGHGIAAGVVAEEFVELRVHRTVHAWSWVGFIQPPGFSMLLHAADGLERAGGPEARWLFFGMGAAVTVLTSVILGVVVGVSRGAWLGLFASFMVVLNPATLRPFEHYPLAQLLTTASVVALLMHADRPARRRLMTAAGLAVLAAGVHVATLLITLPTVATLAGSRPELRRGLGRAVLIGTGVMLVVSVPDFWIQIRQPTMASLPPGGANVGWSNPALVGLLLPALMLRRVEAVGPAVFAGVVFGLQALQLLNGVPFPSGMYYFVLVDPLLVWAAVGVVASLPSGALRVGSAWMLLATQFVFFLRGVAVLWGDVDRFAAVLAPWRWF